MGRKNRIGGYEILEEIGEGGFGKTYKARHLVLEELACIKHGHHVSSEDEEILLNETRVIWDLRHVGLPAVRDVYRLSKGNIAIAMSYIPDPTLEKVINKVKKLDSEHVAWIAERSLNVLGYLHYNGIVHGDVKPSNLMVNDVDHRVTLIDFGLSTIRPDYHSKNLGYTPYFAPPEVTSNRAPPLPQADFYGLGMTMIYALNGDDSIALENKVIPKDVPSEIKNFIERLIVYDPKSRPRWEDENLVETLGKARAKSFGRRRTNGEKIKGLKGGAKK
jgi:eukaryotic-like serine/threonine-protein kinase